MTTRTDAAWAAVRTTEPAALSRDGCETLLIDVRRIRSWLDSLEIATTRRIRELADAGRAEAPESLIATAGGCTGRDARDVEQRTDLCNQAPTLGDALADGDLTAAHLDAINNAAKKLPADVRADFLAHSNDLLIRARHINLDTFARECRDLAKHLLAMSRRGLSDADELEAQRAASKITRWVDTATGMHHTILELDPVRDARLNATMNAALARLRATDGNKNTPWPQLQVNAFLDAITGTTTPPPTGTNGSVPSSGCVCGHDAAGARRVDRVPEITLLVSYDLLTGLADSGICETENGIPIPISTARRLCCDAEIIPTLLGTNSEVLDQGRSARTANRAQRRALRSVHRGCAYPDCAIGFDACRIHHVKWWWRDNGPTDIDNMLPLCEHHHHLVHEGGWTLTLQPDRTATWQRPDGTIHHQGTTIDRTPTTQTSIRRDTATTP